MFTRFKKVDHWILVALSQCLPNFEVSMCCIAAIFNVFGYLNF
jgi:hypothetical protein